MVSLEHITKKYGNLTVYNDFSLGLEEGKITCLLGESGCGKTTLLNILAGLTPYQGDIKFHKENATPSLKNVTPSPKNTTPLTCSYVFQQPRLVPNLTVKNNLLLVCKDEKRIDEMLQRVAVYDKKDAYPQALSGGQAQRVALARAFLFEADIMLLDEPFSSLDYKLKLAVMQVFLNEQKRQQKTAVFVTHDIDEALYLADRVLLLHNGTIQADLTIAEGNRAYAQSPQRGELLQRILNE